MSGSDVFFDTSVLLYLLSADEDKADRAEALMADGGHISVQVLNEFASVASRKLKMPWKDVREILSTVRAVCDTHALSLETHDQGLQAAERYQLSLYDAMIVASALLSGSTVLYSEDLQHGQRIEKRLTIRNPFVAS
jgi:predicted nucleic acid-binding protein